MISKFKDRECSIPVLAYHEVHEESEREKNVRTMGPSCSLQRDIFRQHLVAIREKKITTTSFDELFAFQNISRENFRKKLILTFDDGHAGNFLYAYPLLMEIKLNAVFFVTTSLINSANMMDWSQLREMADKGMSIQSHGVSHEPLETLSDSELESELALSKKIIEDNIGKAVDAISLPHGSMHKKTLAMAKAIGYRFICTSIIDYLNPITNDQVLVVPRIPITDTLSLSIFNDIIYGKSKIIYTWKRNQRLRWIIRRIIGVNNYRRLYRLIYNIKIEKS